jgi:hypothetical protein
MIRSWAWFSLALGCQPAALAAPKVAISSNFEGGSIGRVQQAAPDHTSDSGAI